MIFSPPLEEAKLIKRYKRFLADIITPTGEQLTIHCANTGSMLNCMQPGGRIWFNRSSDPNRKTSGSWILSETPQGRLACVNTGLANKIIEEALWQNNISELEGFINLRREVNYGIENSRIDFCLEYPDHTTAFIEVKNVTLGFTNTDVAAFPDAITTRGTKHLRELIELAKHNIKTYLFYCVSLTHVCAVRACQEIDANYSNTLQIAQQAGVKIIAYNCSITPNSIKLNKPLRVIVDQSSDF